MSRGADQKLTFRGLLDAQMASMGQQCFSYFDDESCSWSQLAADASAMAAALVALGLRREECVALYGRNSRRWLAVWLGAPEAGVITVPVNTAYTGEFLLRTLRDTKARVVFTDVELLPNVLAVAPELPSLHTLIVEGDATDLPSRPGLAIVSTAQLGGFGWEGPHVQRPLRWDEPSSIFWTSGTTGPSKGVVVSQHYLLCGARTFADLCAMNQDDVVYSALPLFHVGGAVGHVLGGMSAGATLVVDSDFHTSTCWDRIRHYDATVVLAATTMLRFLMRQNASPEDSSLPLRLIQTGSLEQKEHAAAEERYRCAVRSVYGMTEAFPLCVQPAGTPVVPESLGQPNPHFEIRLVDPCGIEVPIGTPGEVVCRPRGPRTMFNGYHNQPAETLAQFDNLWFHTGDLARRDPAGNLFFVDRAKDSIRRRGENVSAFEVERAVVGHDAVRECAAFGVPSDLSGEDIKVCIVLNDGTHLDAEELFAHCTDTLPAFAVPRFVEVVPALPRNAVGRVQKAELRSRPMTASTWDRIASRGA